MKISHKYLHTDYRVTSQKGLNLSKTKNISHREVIFTVGQLYGMVWTTAVYDFVTCMYADWYTQTQALIQKHTQRYSQTSGCQVWHTSLNTSCHHFSCLAVPVSFTLSPTPCHSLYSFHTPPPIFLVSAVFSHLSKCEAGSNILLVCVCWHRQHPSCVNVTPTHLHRQSMCCCQLKKFLQADFQLAQLWVANNRDNVL